MFILRSVYTNLTDIFFFCTRFSSCLVSVVSLGELFSCEPLIRGSISVYFRSTFFYGGVHIFISLFLSSKAFLLLYSSEAVVFSFINFISISISFFPHMSVKVVVSASYLLSRCRFFHYNLFPCHCFMKLRFILDVISTRD